MSDDIIERAELALAIDPERCGWRPFVVDLIAALKAERAENERLRRCQTCGHRTDPNLAGDAADGCDCR